MFLWIVELTIKLLPTVRIVGLSHKVFKTLDQSRGAAAITNFQDFKHFIIIEIIVGLKL